ncbi:MAG: hypothetical protein JSS51_12190 [Planctomycetes bacterium]|nr:hypothetical protein [Planctomycetota bacterium]
MPIFAIPTLLAQVAESPATAAWLFVGCAVSSLLALALVRLLRLDALARAVLAPQPSRAEIVQRLEQLARHSARRDTRAIRRTGDTCSWRLFRRGAELLAQGAQPADIAHKLEHIAQVLTARKSRRLKRISAFSCGLVVFPLFVVLTHAAGAIGLVPATSEWVAGAAFVGVLGLLITSSVARWLSERAEDGLAARTLETEALIFGLSAICGGAGPEEVGSMTRLVLGMAPAETALRRAA